MCGCVSGEVLRQCIAGNPSDIYLPPVCSLQRWFMYAYEVHSLLPLAPCTVFMSSLPDKVR